MEGECRLVELTAEPEKDAKGRGFPIKKYEVIGAESETPTTTEGSFPCNLLHVTSSNDAGLHSDNDNFSAEHSEREPEKVTSKNSDWDKVKLEEIESVISSTDVDLKRLRELALDDGGLLHDDIRKKAWPLLMDVSEVQFSPKPSELEVKGHHSYSQVVLDVKRSLKRFPPGIEESCRTDLMDQLTTLIIQILMKHPELHYYQGFHDVAVTFLLVVGENMGFELVERLCLNHLYEFMQPTMERTTYYLTYLYPILRRANPFLHQYIERSNVGTMFCLPWLITWYAHTLSDYRHVVRLYDFLLSSPYLMPMYLAASIVLEKEEEVLQTECDMAMQHCVLSQVPDTLPFESILKHALVLYESYPPDMMQMEVDELVARKKQLENEERRQIEKQRKTINSKRQNKFAIVSSIVSVPWTVRSTATAVGIVAVFVTITMTLYAYYKPQLPPVR